MRQSHQAANASKQKKSMKNSKVGNKAMAKPIKKREGKDRYADADLEEEVDGRSERSCDNAQL